MELSINTDFMGEKADIREPLKLICEAGFKYIHWCHHWNDDYLYSNSEISIIRKLLKEYGLTLFDLHSSHGKKMDWCSTDEEKRAAGEELLLNRIQMTHTLGGRAITLHTNIAPLTKETMRRTEQGIKTLTSLEPFCRRLGIRIGLENLNENGGEASLYELDRYFSVFPPDYIGFCWDTGHSNLIENGINRILPYTERLLILHLNGNNGERDDHFPIGEGTVDWDRVMKILAASTYNGTLTQEVAIQAGMSPKEFLKKSYKQGKSFAAKLETLK